MAHSRATFLWEKLQILSFLQFPWRFLTIATFAFSVAAGSLVAVFPGKKQKMKIIGAAVVLLILFNGSFFRPSEWLSINDLDKFSGENWEKQQTISIFDYLPIYADYPPSERAPETIIATEGEIVVMDSVKKSSEQRWTILVSSEKAKLSLPLFYFPGWVVFVDGERIPIDYNNELGVITFNIRAGEHVIRAVLENTPIRSVSNAATIVGLLGVGLFSV